MTIVICDNCHEAAAQTTVWIDGVKGDVCSLCALAYASETDGPGALLSQEGES